MEPWIAQRPYRSAAGQKVSDLDIAKGKCSQDILEDHWDNFMTEDDWQWLSDRGINTVRIPVSTSRKPPSVAKLTLHHHRSAIIT